mmetsp:Transcript_7778/g.7963  ORF Transcript_7778/g.7963 Transcript_7778/m.7963 type:complete len:415 (+) Transcript_7778:73-1317(+)
MFYNFTLSTVIVLLLLSLMSIRGFLKPLPSRNFDHRIFSQERYINEWLSFGGCNVLLPVDQKIPKSIVHFTGGFLAGSAVTVGYSQVLQYLASKGHLIIATPIPSVEFNHHRVALETYQSFQNCYYSFILPTLGNYGEEIPVIGLSHSLGGKLMVLTAADNKKSLHSANIFISFNNFGAKDSIDISARQMSKLSPELQQIFDAFSFQQITSLLKAAKPTNFKDIFSSAFKDVKLNAEDDFDMSDVFQSTFSQQASKISEVIGQIETFTTNLDFTPPPAQTWDLVQQKYDLVNNVLFRFDKDDIDQSLELARRLRQGGCEVELLTLPGAHTTPNAVDFDDKNTIIFFKELARQLDRLADSLPGRTGRDRTRTGGRVSPEKYYLPGSTGSNTGGVYLPSRSSGGDGDTTSWDSDDY